MRLRPLVFALAVVATPGRAQTPNAPPPASLPSIVLPDELDRVLRDYERAWRAGDENALAALFTEDGFVPTGQGWVRGPRVGLRHPGHGGLHRGCLRVR